MVGVLIALVVGAMIGWIWQRLVARPLLQDVAAGVIGWLAGAFTGVLSVFDSVAIAGSGGLGAVSFGISDTVLPGVPVVLVLLAAGHLVRRHTGGGGGILGRYSPALVGALASAAAALWILHRT
jgi:hypothetical protein